MTNDRNLIMAIVLSVAILFGFQLFQDVFFPKPAVTPGAPGSTPPGTATAPAMPDIPRPEAGVAVPPGAPDAAAVPARTAPSAQDSRAAVIARTPRVKINTPRLHGSISLVGGRIDDLTLADYRESLDPGSPEIVLFSPPGAAGAYFIESGWVASGTKVALPGPETRWTASGATLGVDEPVTLSWNNGQGLVFKKIFAVDRNFMFTFTQAVENNGAETVVLNPYSLVSRHGTPSTSGFFILHEGPLGVFDGTLKEVSYKDLQEAGMIQKTSTGGWIGITDKYWLAAVIPGVKEAVNARFVHQRVGDIDKYQVDFLGSPRTIAPGEEVLVETHSFAGAKEVRLLDYYSDFLGIQRFDLAIDFGWFYFLTKPIFYFLIYINDVVGNFGISILILTVAIKLAFFPLANKSYRAMSQMRKLQPEMVKLRERFGDDRARLNQEMMALYKREKVNPASGCLPIIIQIPVFFALYKVLFVTIEMRHAPFFGWIRDLSAPDPTTLFNLFGLIPWDPPQILMIGAWPLIMGVTMYLQQKLNPQPPDPIQAKIFMLLPVVFTVMLAQFPSGLVIYWTWNNILSIVQQWVIMRRMGVKV